MRLKYCLAVPLLFLVGSALAEEVDVPSLSAKLRAVGPKGDGHREAIAAWKSLSKSDVAQLPAILKGMKGAGKLSENWFRAAVEAVAQAELKRGGKLPIDGLEAVLVDTSQSPRARRLAYELITGVDSSAESRLIPGLLNDPSLELRRDAVTLAIAEAAKLEEAGKKDAAVKQYRTAFTAARALDQIKATTEKLRSFEQQVNVSEHMGFVPQWHLVGPFDNTNGRGFDVAYPPEKQVDLGDSYKGKTGEVKWLSHVTKDQYGIVDLNIIFDRPKEGENYKLTDDHKGAIGYAYSEFLSSSAAEVDLRIGCINANKVWLNGELLTANKVYHAGMEVDQYLAQGRLKPGKNKILVKVCQNEQEESWAQRWQFQLRVCDQIGTAVLSQDRNADKTAAR
jgi:hypothetical protein